MNNFYVCCSIGLLFGGLVCKTFTPNDLPQKSYWKAKFSNCVSSGRGNQDN